MADTPSAAASPACDSRPSTSRRTLATPRRPFLRSPLGCGGSRPSTAAAFAAASITASRPVGLEISSSQTSTAWTGWANGMRISLMRRTASSSATSAPFMSTVPGPYAREPVILNGRRARVPAGQTVSKCATTARCWPGVPAGPRVARRWSPAGPGTVSTSAPSSVSRSASTTRSAPSNSESPEGDSRFTSSASRRSTSSRAAVARRRSSASAVGDDRSASMPVPPDRRHGPARSSAALSR